MPSLYPVLKFFETCRKEIPDLEKELKEVWKERIHIVKEFPDSVSWIKKLKEKGYRVYLLSNYAKTTFEEAIKCFEFLNYVDGRVISYEIKAIKPEKLPPIPNSSPVPKNKLNKGNKILSAAIASAPSPFPIIIVSFL